MPFYEQQVYRKDSHYFTSKFDIYPDFFHSMSSFSGIVIKY